MIGACGVVVATTRGFGEGIICIVYLLKFTSSLSAFRGVCGDAVGVCFEGCSVWVNS